MPKLPLGGDAPALDALETSVKHTTEEASSDGVSARQFDEWPSANEQTLRDTAAQQASTAGPEAMFDGVPGAGEQSAVMPTPLLRRSETPEQLSPALAPTAVEAPQGRGFYEFCPSRYQSDVLQSRLGVEVSIALIAGASGRIPNGARYAAAKPCVSMPGKGLGCGLASWQTCD